MRQELRQFVINNFLFGVDDDEFRDEDSFLEKGLLDSTGVLELVAFLEEKYRIKVEDDELIPDNLDSIAQVMAYVNRKVSAKVTGEKFAATGIPRS